MRNPEELRAMFEDHLGDLRISPALGGLEEAVRYALEGGCLVHLLPGLLEAGHPPGHDERLRLRPRFRQPALHEEEVEPLFHLRQRIDVISSPFARRAR